MSVTLSCTHGVLDIDLFWKDTPRTCRNFLELCKACYYDGSLFHVPPWFDLSTYAYTQKENLFINAMARTIDGSKIVPDFMCQSGDPSGTGRGGVSIYGPHFNDEISAKHSHDKKGVVSMANFGRNTNSSQFFIIFKASPHLDGKHTVFGQVQEKSLGVLEQMQRVKTRSYIPVYPVKLFVAEVLEDPWNGQPLPRGAKIPLKPLIGGKSPADCFLQ